MLYCWNEAGCYQRLKKFFAEGKTNERHNIELKPAQISVCIWTPLVNGEGRRAVAISSGKRFMTIGEFLTQNCVLRLTKIPYILLYSRPCWGTKSSRLENHGATPNIYSSAIGSLIKLLAPDNNSHFYELFTDNLKRLLGI